MPVHPLVAIGDSLTQGFMSGAIHRTDLSFPAMVAQGLGALDRFEIPRFTGAGGLPINLERIVRELSRSISAPIGPFDLLYAAQVVSETLDETEDYWERGPGSRPTPSPASIHNLAVWGFEVGDAWTLTPRVCERRIPPASDDFLPSLPECAMYRTARRVLNPEWLAARQDASQIECLRALASDGGIERLIVFLGPNNALGTVTSLSIRWSERADLDRPRDERKANLYRAEHFATLFARLADRVSAVGAQNVLLATVPHVTVPPITRGVAPESRDAQGYYDFYTRPWIWDSSFDDKLHPHLTREQVRTIDATIDAYNVEIKRVAAARGWLVVDTAKMLDELAFRRSGGAPTFRFPSGLEAALKLNPRTRYLVTQADGVKLDTRYIVADPKKPGRITQGGLFSLDGIHPTVIGYGLIADAALAVLKSAGAAPPGAALDWDAIVKADSLVTDPPALISDLQDFMGLADDCGLLSRVADVLS